jgi:hypothetical protein
VDWSLQKARSLNFKWTHFKSHPKRAYRWRLATQDELDGLRTGRMACFAGSTAIVSAVELLPHRVLERVAGEHYMTKDARRLVNRKPNQDRSSCVSTPPLHQGEWRLKQGCPM